MMLDMRRTFDEMVLEYSDSERCRGDSGQQVLPDGCNVAGRYAGTWPWKKLGQLLAQDRWDLVVVDTATSRNALDFLDAPKRLGSFMDSRMWKLFLGPGRGFGKLVTGAMGLAMKAVSTIVGSQMLSDAANFVQSLDSTFGGFREKADRTYELLKRRGTQFVVVSAAEPDALREATFFVDRLSEEGMPLAGLILNRTHPMLCPLTVERAIDGAVDLRARGRQRRRWPPQSCVSMPIAGRRRSRRSGCCPGSPAPIRTSGSLGCRRCRSMSDMDALQAIADQITGET